MAANKGKAQGGKKKKAGKNGKANAPSNTKPASSQANEGPETPECVKQLQAALTAFIAMLDRKLKKSPEQKNMAVALAQVSLVVISGEERKEEHVDSLISIFNELCENENPVWTQTSQKPLVSALSDKFTKWASSEGLLFQYTRALIDNKMTSPMDDAPDIMDTATHDYGKIAQSILDYSKTGENGTNDDDDTSGEKGAAGPSLDSMIEALSASGVEVSAKEASSASSTQQSTQSSTQPAPKDPKQVAQAFLMFKPYMSQMIEARRKAEQQVQALETNCLKLLKRVEKLEQAKEPQLLSKDVEAVYEPDPRLTLDNNTKEFMREHFKAFLSQYKLREEYFKKLLKARSSETAVQIMKVKKYRELSKAGWRMASEALDSLAKVDDRVLMMDDKFTTYKTLTGATIESLVQEHESSKRDFKHLELEHEQTKNKTELMNVMMSDVVAYNAELKETLSDFKDLAEAWRVWAEVSKPMIAPVLPELQMQAMDGILMKTEGLVPREADDPQPPTDDEIEEMLRKGRLEGKTVEQVSQEVIAATELALKQARERREKRANNSSAMAARVNKHVDHVMAAHIKSDEAITEETVKQVIEAAKVLEQVRPTDPASSRITEVNEEEPTAPVAPVAPAAKQPSPVIPSLQAKETAGPSQTEKKQPPKTADAPPKPDTDGYEADVDDTEADKALETTEAKAVPPAAGLPEPPVAPTGSAYSAALGPAPDSHLTVYSPVHTDDEDRSREAAHDEADGEDDDDFGFKRYVAHEGDVSSEEDEYFLRAKFGICYHDRYTRRGKSSSKGAGINSYMGVFGGNADTSHNLCTHDMGTDFGQARFADRRGHLFSEVLLHDYVQSDDDTSMQNWTDEVEWEWDFGGEEDEDDKSGSDTDDEDDVKQAAEDKVKATQHAVEVASGVKAAPPPGSAAAKGVAEELENMLLAKGGEMFNAVQIPEAFTDEEWQTLQGGAVSKIIPLLLSYMVAAHSPHNFLTLDRKFPSFVLAPCNWVGAFATMNFLTCYYRNSNGYREKYGWDPIGRTVKSIGDISGLLDESRNLCPVTLDLIPFLLFASRALAEVIVYPTYQGADARDKALQTAIEEHEGFLSVEDLYRLVLEYRAPDWDSPIGGVYTTLLDALVRSSVSLYMRVSRFPFELDKLASLPVVAPVEGTPPSKNVRDVLTKIEDKKSKFLDVNITKIEQVLLHQASASLRRCITKNVYPEDTSIVPEKSIQEKVFAFLAGNGADETYNKVVAHNRPMLMRALDSNQLDVERVAQLHDAYEKLDGQIASVAQTANGTGEGSAQGSASENGNGTSGGNN
ncbi:hypothetical protein CJU89_3289 [Yarrowia sp. B02]|nr:hypothetical protein CJU89_3289 [Yarrowia sp. B02]